MSTYKIDSHCLGDLNETQMEQYAQYCSDVANAAGLDIEFEIDYRNGGDRGDGVESQLYQYVWENCDYWTDNNELKEREIKKAADYFRHDSI